MHIYIYTYIHTYNGVMLYYSTLCCIKDADASCYMQRMGRVERMSRMDSHHDTNTHC